jgi:hypothetical protein
LTTQTAPSPTATLNGSSADRDLGDHLHRLWVDAKHRVVVEVRHPDAALADRHGEGCARQVDGADRWLPFVVAAPTRGSPEHERDNETQEKSPSEAKR